MRQTELATKPKCSEPLIELKRQITSVSPGSACYTEWGAGAQGSTPEAQAAFQKDFL